MDKFKKILKKISKITLVLLLILGILSSGFGIAVTALTDRTPADSDPGTDPGTDTPVQEVTEFVDPTEQYADIGNTAALNDTVTVLTQEQADLLTGAIASAENRESYYGDYTRLYLETVTETPSNEEAPETDTKEEELNALLDQLSDCDTIFLPGDKDSLFGDDRIFQIRSVYTYGRTHWIDVQEPYFEDVFESLEICTSDMLTQDNFVQAYFADGVSAQFGNAAEAIPNATQTGSLGGGTVSTLTASSMTDAQVVTTANQFSTEGGDLIVSLNYVLDSEEEDDVESSLKLTGQFGIRDLQAHLVCDMPRPADFEELYFGLSGEVFANVGVTGSIEAEASMDASKLDTFLFSLEGLSEKRFPIAVFQFQGTTPVYISNAVFEASKDSLLPTLYIILYADWEGKIGMELTSSFEYSHSFNSGLRVFKEGEPCLTFENYPYQEAYSVEDEGGLTWNTNLTLSADTDLTLFGGSVLFYIAGVNIGEISAARLGVEAQCELSLTASSNTELQVSEDVDASCYVRGYLKFLEIKVKLEAEGKAFLEGLEMDVEFEFGVLDLTLFEWGLMPDKFKPDMPISTMPVPAEFESVICLVSDVSGSMYNGIGSGQTKLAAAKEAGKMIVSTTEQWANKYEGNYGIGVVQFASYAQTVALPHIDYKYIRDCISIMDDGGGTSVSAGIDAGIEQLNAVVSDNKVMILMTDGQDYTDSATIASAEAAAAAGITIYTIGFGDDVNEDVLQQAAEATGGEYRFASTDSIMSIVGSFIYAQQSSNAEVLTELESTVGEGETSESSQFIVSDESGDLVVTTAWPGSFLDTILVDPNGRTVDENYPGAVTDESQIPSTITVKDPLSGRWSVKVKGIETSYEQEPFYTIVAFKASASSYINQEMTDMEQIAAWCIPVGLFTSLCSAMLLCCIGRKKKET